MGLQIAPHDIRAAQCLSRMRQLLPCQLGVYPEQQCQGLCKGGGEDPATPQPCLVIHKACAGGLFTTSLFFS